LFISQLLFTATVHLTNLNVTDKIRLSNYCHFITLPHYSAAIHDIRILLTRKICALCKFATCSRVVRKTLRKICNRESRSHEIFSHCLGIIIIVFYFGTVDMCVNCKFVTVGFFAYFSQYCLCINRCWSFCKHRIIVVSVHELAKKH